MLKFEDRCCSCASPGYPCEGQACPNIHVPVYYCDKCRDEICEDVYEVDGQDLCDACLKKLFKKEGCCE